MNEQKVKRVKQHACHDNANIQTRFLYLKLGLVSLYCNVMDTRRSERWLKGHLINLELGIAQVRKYFPGTR